MNSLDFAIKMEKDGEKYYLEQAKLNKDNSLSTVFIMLARDESNHALILKNKLDSLSYDLEDNNTLSESKNVFKGIENFKSEIKEVPSQLDLYRVAVEMESQSIDFYTEFLSEVKKDNDKVLFEFLIKQEEEHFEILEELVLIINRPDDWVEAAEFGLRDEY